jgi:putative transposase
MYGTLVGMVGRTLGFLMVRRVLGLLGLGRSPRANAYAERWVRTVRSECLDWVLIFNHHHLRKVLDSYVAHYSGARPHRGLHLDIPAPPPALSRRDDDTGAGMVLERTDILGGLIHEYRRAA